MKRLLTVLAATSLGLITHVAMAQTADDAFGIWLDPNTTGHLEVYKCGEALCAKIAKLPEGKEAAKDVHNEDVALRERPLMGLVIIESAAKKSELAWGGTIYDRERGKSFDVTVQAKDKNTLDITGCKLAILCKTNTLTRVQ